MSSDTEHNIYRAEKIANVQSIKASGVNPYPHKFETTMTFSSYITEYNSIDSGTRFPDLKESLAGRVLEIRDASSKLIFMTLFSSNQKVQFVFSKELYDTPDTFNDVKKIHRGDIIGVNGFVGKSKHGELSLFANNFVILTPCLDVLPKGHFGLSDNVLKRRYLDMIVNQQVGNTLQIKSQVINYIRDYLNKLEFTEVFTPILQNKAGGANAKPFKTHHNDLNADMVLRIAPELYLKQLVVGGMDRVYEIGQQFRNESIDRTHNPEFLSLEFYMAYTDYNDLMSMCEVLLSGIVFKIKGNYIVEYFNEKLNETLKINFTPPFKRIDFMKELEQHLGKFPDDYSSDEMLIFLKESCETHNIVCEYPQTISRLLDKLAGHFLESQCMNPTFLINHPLIMSPLAKFHRDDPRITERFELFCNYFELCNAYTELNDPFIQRHTFEKQMEDKKNGDDEAQEIDNEFISALEFGLPPCGGFGLGIERLIMLLTNKPFIRDVISFPAHT
jgi:lysyl-tRNA synthetase, class II